ncbi:hypothetical protein, partial [Bradyrhizobium sp. th.b2]|uniref:hypothetical protein n=1 Tax=Bradyrhizobium sp. th-b2 TaxID=172088 RepID=UPI001AEC23EF
MLISICNELQIYQNTLDKTLYMYVRKSDGLPADATPGNWKLLATKQDVSAAAIEQSTRRLLFVRPEVCQAFDWTRRQIEPRASPRSSPQIGQHQVMNFDGVERPFEPASKVPNVVASRGATREGPFQW